MYHSIEIIGSTRGPVYRSEIFLFILLFVNHFSSRFAEELRTILKFLTSSGFKIMINYANIIRRVLFLPVSENRRKDGDYVEDFRVPQEIILLSRA